LADYYAFRRRFHFHFFHISSFSSPFLLSPTPSFHAWLTPHHRLLPPSPSWHAFCRRGMQADAATRAGAACHAARGARRYGAAAAPLRLCRHATALLRAPTRYVVAAVSRRAARSARSAAAQRALMSFFTFLIFDIAFRLSSPLIPDIIFS
jgi:hypothetical protein